ncbi:phospholipid scramblase 2 [Chrysoperla carnea]|uniref:phospholipid scramblase 2 n=1 Tax=Chrysoperla carnea TaxID=189513 RepID=UPI001D08D9E3|nr:phospholipid scramblase 2 [Chrysoperla carnea]
MYNPTQIAYGPSEGAPPLSHQQQPLMSSMSPPPVQAGMPPYPGPPGPPGNQIPPPGYAPQANYPPGPGFQYPMANAPGAPPMMGGPPGPPGPVMAQPTAEANWMHAPQRPVNCPPGLEYLTMIDQLLVHQKVELLEVFTGFETRNKFVIKNSLGQQVYYAVEDSDCCTRNCCGPMRPFDMRIFDNFRNEVIHLNRPLACDSCCFPCCLQSVEVSSPPGTVIGTVEQNWSLCYPSYSVKNEFGATVLNIEGPLCKFSCFGDVKFKVMSADGSTKVGKISKQWSGLIREGYSDSDNFGITFPLDLDVKVKATLLGACMLIDMMFFEKSNNN